MVYVDPEFEVPSIPEDERYEGIEVDENVLQGMGVYLAGSLSGPGGQQLNEFT